MSGNHEGRSAFYEDFKADMEKHHVAVLENERLFSKKKDGAAIMVAGVQDPRFVKENWAEKRTTKRRMGRSSIKRSFRRCDS